MRALRPLLVCRDVAVGLRVSGKRSGGPTVLIHVGDGIYKFLVGLVSSSVYRGKGAAERCAADAVDALEVAMSTQARTLRRPASQDHQQEDSP